MRKLTLLLISLFASLVMNAGEVTEEQALQKAQNFMKGKKFKQKNLHRAPQRNVTTGNASYYVFNAEGNDGFVIVSGDDRIETILGYADKGSFDFDNLPPNLKAWLKYYENTILSLGDIQVKSITRSTSRNNISPLITTNWGQGPPYNDLCPLFGEYHCAAGCVAIAMAQIVNYHQHPASTSVAIPGYTTATLGLQIEEQPIVDFPWNSMTITDISRLIYYCGVAVNMDYAPDGSGASDVSVIPALTKYFGYDSNMKWFARWGMTTEDWEDRIYNELAENRPVLYAGSAEVGHEFVCDGYENGYFHINWGWNGDYNGYFSLSVLNPYGTGMGGSSTNDGYTIGQSIVIGIQPTTSGTTDTQMKLYSNYVSALENNNYSRSASGLPFNDIHIEYAVGNFDNTSFEGDYGIALFSGNQMLSLLASSNVESMPLGWLTNSNIIISSFGSDLADGTYYLRPVYKAKDSESWVVCMASDINYMQLVIQNNVLTLTEYPDIRQVQVNSLTFTGDKENKLQNVILNVTNPVTEYHGLFKLHINGNELSRVGVHLPQGQATDVVFRCVPPTGHNELKIFTENNTLIYSEEYDIAGDDSPFYHLTDNQMIFGYSNTNGYTDNPDGINYPPYDYTVKTAVIFDESMMATVKGNKITHVRFALSSISNMSQVKLWVGSDIDKQDILLQQVEQVHVGWNTVELQTPIMLDGRELYMGYQYYQTPIDGGDGFVMPIACWDMDIAGGGLKRYDGFAEWQALTGGRPGGALALQCLVEGSNVHDYNISIKPQRAKDPIAHSKYFLDSELGGQVEVTGLKTTNLGKKDMNNYVVSYQIDQQDAHAIDNPESSFFIDMPVSLGVGTHQLKFFVSSIDGMTPSDIVQDTLNIEFYVCTQDMGRQKMLLTEYTGMWCPWGPNADEVITSLQQQRGDIVKLTILTDKYNQLVTESSAPYFMDMVPYYSMPFISIDRYGAMGSSLLTYNGYDGLTSSVLDNAKKCPSLATVNISAKLNDDHLLEITVTGERNSEFAQVVNNTNLTVMLTEDNVNTSQYKESELIEDYWQMGVYRKTVTPTWGTPIQWDGNHYTMTFKTSVSAEWNLKNLNVIAFLGNAFNYQNYDDVGVINCNDLSLKDIDLTGIIKEETRLAYTITGENTVSVRAKTQSISGDLEIPSEVEIDGTTYRVTSLEMNGFVNTKLRRVVIPNTVEEIPFGVFNRSTIESLNIPASVTWMASFGTCKNLKEIIVDEANANYKSEDGFLLTKDGTTLLAYAVGNGATTVIVPDGVTSIPSGAFSEMPTLQKAILPEGLTFLGGAFEGAPELLEVNLPSTLEFLGSAFCNCPKLEELTIPKSVTYIADYVVLNCYALKKLKVLHRVPVQVENLNNQGFGVVVYTNATLYVPTGSKATYQADPVWGQFQHIEEEGGILGDVTGSGTVDVQDATLVVNYILGDENDDYDYSVADMNGDSEIDVFDITAIINVILSGAGNHPASSRGIIMDGESLESVNLTAEGIDVLMSIDDASRFTSFQFDVKVPQGVELLGVDWNANVDNRILQFAKTGEDCYTVVALSMESEPLPDGNDLLRLRPSDKAAGDVSVENVLFVTPQGEAVRFGDSLLSVTTGIQGIDLNDNGKLVIDNCYDMNGRQVKSPKKGVYIINNKKVIFK